MEPDLIFSSFELKGFTLRNRLGVAPMTRMSSRHDSVPRADVLEFLVRRAQNGAALVYTEAIVTDYESAQGYPGQARLTTRRQIEAWARVTAAIREAGAVSMMQMFHCGRIARAEVNPAGRTISPSPLIPRDPNHFTGKPYPVPDAMSQFDIDHVILGFVETARGAVAQRYRFLHEIIQGVARVMPPMKLLTVRLSDWGVVDRDVSLFGTKEAWQETIRLLSREPVAAVSVSTYDFRHPGFGTEETMAQLTRAATHLPIMICGQIYDRASAAQALEHADIVLSAKSMLLNPNWVEEVRRGKPLPLYRAEEADIAYTEPPLP